MDLVNKNSFGQLPRRHDVTAFIKEIRKLLYPGYFEEIYCEYGVYIKQLEDRLKKMFLSNIVDDIEIKNCFFDKINEIKDILKTDLEMTYMSDPAAYSKDEIILTYPGLFAISTYRIAHILYELKVPIIPRIMTEYAHSKTGIDIHPGATIGEYFFIDHGTGIVIGETSNIGHHVKIYHGVTLGALSLRKGQDLHGTKRHPTIGNYVTIYSGASILGGSTLIGDYATIGCNAYLMKSVSEYSKVTINVDIEQSNK